MHVTKIVECKGIPTAPWNTSNPALRSLLNQGLARLDPLCIGIDVAPDGALIDQSGRPSERLFAVGPVARAAFWEITAVPDIRTQCAQLAVRLGQGHGEGPTDLAETDGGRNAAVEPRA